MTPKQIERMQKEIRAKFRALAKIYPGAFTKDGKPVVATLTFPSLKRGMK